MSPCFTKPPGIAQVYLDCPEVASGGFSYGMNENASQLTSDHSQKILVLDYEAPTVMADDSGVQWDSAHAARHSGQMNVLYADGHVESHAPSDIDPASEEILQRMWLPTHGSDPGNFYDDVYGFPELAGYIYSTGRAIDHPFEVGYIEPLAPNADQLPITDWRHPQHWQHRRHWVPSLGKYMSRNYLVAETSCAYEIWVEDEGSVYGEPPNESPYDVAFRFERFPNGDIRMTLRSLACSVWEMRYVRRPDGTAIPAFTNIDGMLHPNEVSVIIPGNPGAQACNCPNPD